VHPVLFPASFLSLMGREFFVRLFFSPSLFVVPLSFFQIEDFAAQEFPERAPFLPFPPHLCSITYWLPSLVRSVQLPPFIHNIGLRIPSMVGVFFFLLPVLKPLATPFRFPSLSSFGCRPPSGFFFGPQLLSPPRLSCSLELSPIFPPSRPLAPHDLPSSYPLLTLFFKPSFPLLSLPSQPCFCLVNYLMSSSAALTFKVEFCFSSHLLRPPP